MAHMEPPSILPAYLFLIIGLTTTNALQIMRMEGFPVEASDTSQGSASAIQGNESLRNKGARTIRVIAAISQGFTRFCGFVLGVGSV
jgi:hypothetical protein